MDGFPIPEPLPADCPPPAWLDVCGSSTQEVILSQPLGQEEGVITHVSIECGERVEGHEIKPCARVVAWNVLGERVSQEARIDHYGGLCVPVSEPPQSLMMLVALATVVVIRLARR